MPLFLLSARRRDELARAIERAGWSPVAASGAEDADRRFLESGAAVAVVDAREGFADALAAVRGLAGPTRSAGAALLVLIGRRDATVAAAAFEAGATHYLASPFTDGEFVQAARFAARHAERVADGRRAATAVPRGDDETMRWRWSPVRPRWVTLDAALARLAGLPFAAQEIGRYQAGRLLGREGLRAAVRAIAGIVAGERPSPFVHGGERGYAHHPAREADGRIGGRVERLGDDRGGVPDARLETARARDPLTGLDDGHGARAWIDARLASGAPTLLVLGLGRFDMVDAAFGRETGDAIIRAVARRVERVSGRAMGTDRLLARLAGAEFAIGLPGAEPLADAERLAADLVAAIARPFVAGDHVVTLGARIGIAEADADVVGAGADELIRRAGVALADARRGETARVRVYRPGDESRRADDRRLELDLRHALDEERIEIVWQPQVSIATGRVCGAEALARWRHPEFGEIGAEALFAVAGRSDYATELSAHVQERALAIAAGWEGGLATLPVSINVTAADVADPGFAAALLDRIDAAGLARERVTVEVTESGLIEELGDAAALLARLRAAGVRVAIDDFGTGYSSLAYLKALPLDTIKIDRALAQDIAGSPRGRIVVRSVIEMARSLGLTVVAEGVETEEQLALLAREGCTLYQGFLFSAPVDAGALAGVVAGAAALSTSMPS